MKTLLTMTLFAASLVYGQQKPAEGREAATIPVKTLSGDSFDRLVRMLGVFDDARINGDSQLRVIAVYAPKEVVSQIRHLVEELDKPGSEAAIGRNIEMTLTFLRCYPKAAAAPASLPADIEPVARQIRAATQYKDIQFWDSVPMHLQEGKEATSSLRLPGTLPGIHTGTNAQIRVRPELVGNKSGGRYVRFGTMRVEFRIPMSTNSENTQYTYLDSGINTSGDFMENQKTVLGKVSGTEDESAIFVVVALKVLE